MSANLLNKVRSHRYRLLGKRPETHAPKKSQWRMLLILPAWIALAYTAGNFLLKAAFLLMAWAGMPINDLLRPAILQTTVSVLVYTITIVIVIGVPYKLGKKTTKEDVGLTRLPSWTDIGLAPVGFIVYSLAVAGVLAVIISLLPQLPLNQVQETGFSAFGSRLDNILAFATLVVLAPFAEELLFRGYLYGKLKAYVPTIVAALAVSLLFAIAHGQLNLGIDVFVLSLVLCVLRSLTNSIWAGVLVHMIKNALAYYLLFVAPLVGGS